MDAKPLIVGESEQKEFQLVHDMGCVVCDGDQMMVTEGAAGEGDGGVGGWAECTPGWRLALIFCETSHGAVGVLWVEGRACSICTNPARRRMRKRCNGPHATTVETNDVLWSAAKLLCSKNGS